MKIIHWLVGLSVTSALVACDKGESGTGSNVIQTTGDGGAGGEHSDGLGSGVPSNTADPSASIDTDALTDTDTPTTVETPAGAGSTQNGGAGTGGASTDSSEPPSETETSSDIEAPTSDGELTDDGDSDEFTATAEDTETLVEDDSDPLPDGGITPVDEGEVFMCMPDAAGDVCERCVQSDCCDERSDCAADEQCSAEWDGMKSCMAERELANNPVADPVATVEECVVEVAGGQLAASDALYSLLSCVGAPFLGDADDNRLEGDGVCTLACYGVDTLEPPLIDDPEFDLP